MTSRSMRLLLFLSALGSISTQAVTIVSGGQSDYVIVVPASPSPSVEFAAGELQRFLEEMTGAKLPITPESAPEKTREIVLGATGRLGKMDIHPDMQALGPEGYMLRTVKEKLAIAGSPTRGVMYGVYGLLEEHLGCRWFTPDVTNIPKSTTLDLGSIDETVIPTLQYRWPAVRDCYDGDWCARNRVNVGPGLKEHHGGAVTFCGWAHTFEHLVPVKEFYDAHPEYFSLVDGKRLNGREQLCCTNEDVINIIIDRMRKRMHDTPQATYFSVSQNDWGNYCQCPKCVALAEKEGSQMGPVLYLVNRVAEAVENEFPEKRITTLAYQWSRRPPKTIRPRKNVTIRLCTIECCFAHPFGKCDFPANQRFIEDIMGWSEICDNLWIWNYTTNFRNYYLPHPTLRAINDDIRFFIKHHVKGIYEQDTKLTLNGDMSQLGGYMMAKFLWNPDYDEDTAMNEFLDAVYGPAASYIRQYVDLIHDKVDAENLHVRCFGGSTPDFLPPELLEKSTALFDKAEDASRNDATIHKRVQFARMPVDYAIIERARNLEPGEWTIDHEKFRVTPTTPVRHIVDRFLKTAQEANVMTMSERRLPLSEYEDQIKLLTPQTLPPADPVSTAHTIPGLRYRYYEAASWPKDRDLSKLTPIASGQAEGFTLQPRRRDKMFGFIFDGLINAHTDGVYTFYLRAESGSELTVANQTIIGGTQASAGKETAGMVALRKGWHPIRLRFLEFGYNDGLSLTIEGPGMPKQAIPPTSLRHNPMP